MCKKIVKKIISLRAVSKYLKLSKDKDIKMY